MDLKALLPEIGDRYGLGPLQLGPALTGGEWNEVYRIEAAAGFYVLRIAHPTTTLEALTHSHLVMGALYPRIPEVASPLRNRDGETWVVLGGRLHSLLPWVSGVRGDVADPAFRSDAACLLAKVHLAGRRSEWAPHPVVPPLREMEWGLSLLVGLAPHSRASFR